jgi:hypothetical protein
VRFAQGGAQIDTVVQLVIVLLISLGTALGLTLI